MKFNVEHVSLEKLFFGVNGRVSQAVLSQLSAAHRDHPFRMARFYEELDPVFNDMLFTFSGYLLSLRDEKKIITISVPTTWWDHLKDDLLKSGVEWKVWLAQRFAVPQYITKSQEYTETRVCPHSNSYFPEDKSHLDFLVWRNDGNQVVERSTDRD